MVRYVEQEGNEFYGEVESESDYDLTYEVSVWFDQDIEEFCTECDCFVGYQCKHAAALAHAYLDTHVLNSKAGMTIDHEPQQLMSFEVASWMKSFTTPETPARNLNQPKKALFYYLSHPDNGHNTKSIFKSLNAVSSKQNKNGSWSKVQSLEHISHHLLTDDLVTPTDLTALLPVNILLNE